MKNTLLKLETISKAMEDPSYTVRKAMMNACKGREEVPIELMRRGLGDLTYSVRKIAMDVCKEQGVSFRKVRKWLEEPSQDTRRELLRAYKRQEVSKGCEKGSLAWDGQRQVFSSYEEISSLDMIRELLSSPRWYVRTRAMTACIGREDIPLDVLQAGLEDSDCDVREAAVRACKGRAFPPVRDFEPRGLVYKKCLKGVIVVAEIPQDAHIRGGFGRKCRASGALIREVIGDFYGERVGISFYDLTTMYRERDVVEIEDFDLGRRQCSTGYHFFNSLAEVEHS